MRVRKDKRVRLGARKEDNNSTPVIKMTHSGLLIYRDLYDCSIDKSGEILWEVRATWEVKKGEVTTEWKTPRKK